jgi:hypothetical protein
MPAFEFQFADLMILAVLGRVHAPPPARPREEFPPNWRKRRRFDAEYIDEPACAEECRCA